MSEMHEYVSPTIRKEKAAAVEKTEQERITLKKQEFFTTLEQAGALRSRGDEAGALERDAKAERLKTELEEEIGPRSTWSKD